MADPTEPGCSVPVCVCVCLVSICTSVFLAGCGCVAILTHDGRMNEVLCVSAVAVILRNWLVWTGLSVFLSN